METDEEQIREVISTWMAATKAGDVDTVLSLMTDDVVFLVAGRPPMRKPDFAAQAREMAKPGGPRFDGTSDVREVRVAGEWAYVWSELVVEATLPTGKMRRQGPTLSIFRKEAGRWRLARDANLLGPPQPH